MAALSLETDRAGEAEGRGVAPPVGVGKDWVAQALAAAQSHPALTDTGAAALIEAPAALQAQPVFRLHHLAVHGPVDNSGGDPEVALSLPCGGPGFHPATAWPWEGLGHLPTLYTGGAEKEHSLFAPHPAAHPPHTPHLHTQTYTPHTPHLEPGCFL